MRLCGRTVSRIMSGTGNDPLDSYSLSRFFRELFKVMWAISKTGIHSNGQINLVATYTNYSAIYGALAQVHPLVPFTPFLKSSVHKVPHVVQIYFDKVTVVVFFCPESAIQLRTENY